MSLLSGSSGSSGSGLSTTVYYGWFCPAIQQLRIDHPTVHMFRGKRVESPPYTYYNTPDGRKVLVTEITESNIPTDRQVKNGDVFVGEVTTCYRRSYLPERNF